MSFIKQSNYSNINEGFNETFPSTKFKPDKRVKKLKKQPQIDISQKPMFNTNNVVTMDSDILDGRDLRNIDSSQFNNNILNGYHNESNYSYVSNELPKRSAKNTSNNFLRDVELETNILRPIKSRDTKKNKQPNNIIESHYYQYIDPTDTVNVLPRQGICTRTQNKKSKIKGYNRKIY